jgi:two-component system chemotaxis response regulator CheB
MVSVQPSEVEVKRDLVVIGASAGGLEALRRVVSDLPTDLQATVCVVLHIAPGSPSALAPILQRAGRLPCRQARAGDELRLGEILVAPPDRHLIVRDHRVHLSSGPRQNGVRPAVDALFRSAALAYGPGVLAVVLSGALDDGTVGAAAVAAQDGTVFVQDPEEARVSSMPRSTLAAVRRAVPVATADLGGAIADWVRRPPPDDPSPSTPGPDDRHERSSAMAVPTSTTDHGIPAALGCPECQGGMYESVPDGAVTYTCHVGHAWSAQSLLEAERKTVEAVLYNASSKLLEIATVHRRLAEFDGGAGHREQHLREAQEAEQRADRIRQIAVERPEPD